MSTDDMAEFFDQWPETPASRVRAGKDTGTMTETTPAITSLTAEDIARAFHATYEHLAPQHGYKTREASAVEWDQVPENNRHLMTHVVERLLETGFIRPGTKVAAAGERARGVREGLTP